MTEDSTYAIEFSTLKLKNLFTNYPTLKKINDLSFASFKSDLIKIWNIDSEKPIQTLSLHEEFANFVVINLNYNEESLGFLTD